MPLKRERSTTRLSMLSYIDLTHPTSEYTQTKMSMVCRSAKISSNRNMNNTNKSRISLCRSNRLMLPHCTVYADDHTIRSKTARAGVCSNVRALVANGSTHTVLVKLTHKLTNMRIKTPLTFAHFAAQKMQIQIKCGE